MDALILVGANCAILLVLGGLLGIFNPKRFSARWLFAAAILLLINDAMLTRLYRLVPNFIPGAEWNWEGKLMALAASIIIASLGVFGWRRSGLTFRQLPGSLGPALVVLGLYVAFFVGLVVVFGGEEGSAETIAFQLTMPGLEEEIFFRGIFLLALNEAFRGRVRFLGIRWGWGALLSSFLFGLGHALSYSAGEGFLLDPVTLALAAVPSLLAVWLRERTGSIVMPILAHNAGNSISLLI